MNNRKNIRAYERRTPGEKVKQNRAKTVNVCGIRKLGCWALGLLGRDVAGCSKCLQRSCEIAILIEPFCQTEVAHHRFAIFIKQNVSRLKIAMQNSLAMSVSNGAGDLRHQS